MVLISNVAAMHPAASGAGGGSDESAALKKSCSDRRLEDLAT